MAHRKQVFRLLRRHGWNATSFQVLKPGFRYWVAPDGEAAVAYVDTGRYWMGAGAPICSAARLAGTAADFAAAARGRGRRAAFFGCVGRLVDALRQGPEPYDFLQVGSQATWDPRRWEAGLAGTSLPAQVRRAARKGVEAREIPPGDLGRGRPLRQAADALVARWLERHGMAPMAFLVDLAPFLARTRRRYFGAFLEGRLVALLVAAPIYARRGWFLESLLFDPPVPNGTAEALIDLAMRTLGGEGARFATMGISALAGLPGHNVRHPRLGRVLRFCYDSLNWLYSFEGIKRFQDRLHPHDWEPVYLLSHEKVDAGTIWAVLRAFAGGRLDRFAWRTARKRLRRAGSALPRHRWAALADLLAALLVPWIGVLLAADSQTWFGAPWLGRAWASFDAAVAAGLFTLARGIHRGRAWARPLARVLLGVVLADAWLTLAQALLYNAPRASGPLDWVVLGVACAAPPLAAAFLASLTAWGPLSGRRR